VRSKPAAVPLAIVLAMLLCSSAQAAQMLGVQTHLLWADVDQREMEHQLDLVKESGASLARVDVGWGSLQERGPDRFEPWHLSRLDRVVDAAEARGVKLLLTLTNTPCWASSAPEAERQGCAGEWWARDVTRWAPADPSTYARALAFLVDRYEHRVAAWQVWNEPNSTAFWRASDPARAYAELVKAAYPAAKAAYPGATILAGALSQSDHQFTQRLYDHGIRGFFDAFSFHPYCDDAAPGDPRGAADARYSFVRGVPAVRDVMLRNGDSRPVWLTESGWSTSTVRGAAPYLNGVSEADQARFLREQATLVKRWPYVKALIWFNLLDRGSDRSSLVDNFGLRRVNGTAKPAWAAFREAAADRRRTAARSKRSVAASR
jgi:polysaccharide biosynthesis protein PslG